MNCSDKSVVQPCGPCRMGDPCVSTTPKSPVGPPAGGVGSAGHTTRLDHILDGHGELHRPVCATCSWRGSWHATSVAAESEADAHLDAI